MKITSVSYGRTINLGSYESAKICLTSETTHAEWKKTLQALENELLRMEKRLKKGGTL